MQQFMTVRQAAAIVRLSPKTIYGWIREGRFPGYKLNGTVRIDRAEFMEYLKKAHLVRQQRFGFSA